MPPAATTLVWPTPKAGLDLRFFAGLEVRDVAAVLGVSEATVKRDWSFAKAWLLRDLRA